MQTRLLAGTLMALSVISHPLPRAGEGDGGGEGGGDGGKGGGQAPPAGGGQEPSGKGNGGGNGGGQEPEKFDAEYVKGLRSEAAANRKKAADAEAKLKALEDEKLSDSEKRDKRLKELEAENTRVQSEARMARAESRAVKAGAIDAEVVAMLVPADAADLDAAIAEIKKARPHLFQVKPGGSADGGAGGTAPHKTMNDFIRGARG